MAAISLAVIGKNSEPLYIKEFYDDRLSKDLLSEEELFGLPPPAADGKTSTSKSKSIDCSLRQQFILHAALDRFEQLSGPPPGYAWRKSGVTGSDAMFVGLLCPVEDLRVYGYMTTTQIKFLITLEDNAISADQSTVDETIKRLFIKIHRLFVEYTLNPFSSLNKEIVSDRFDSKIKEIVTAYNRAVVSDL